MNDSGFGRLIGALVSPDKTFRSIAERPTWAAPMILVALCAIGVGWIAQERVDQGALAKYQMDQFGLDLSKEQQEAMESRAASQSPALRTFGLVFGGGAAAALYMVIAALFLVVFKMAGSEVDFLRSLSTSLYGMLPSGVVGALLNIGLSLPREEITPEELMSGGVLTSSLRPLAPEDSPVVQSLLGSVDFFSLWSVVLLILGYRAVAKVSTQTSATVVLVLWGLWVLGKAGVTAVLR